MPQEPLEAKSVQGGSCGYFPPQHKGWKPHCFGTIFSLWGKKWICCGGLSHEGMDPSSCPGGSIVGVRIPWMSC